ncbi:MAG: potassium channel family protein [Armatimonadota bacterium]
MLYKKLSRVAIAFLTVLGIGTIGYHAIERWNFFDALYMTIITIASVGYGETHPLSDAGRAFTMLLILGGAGVLVFTFSTVTAVIVEGELSDVLRRRRMQQKIEKMCGHYVICGAGRMGQYIINELGKTRQNFVVIEKDPERVAALESAAIPCVQGDATHEAVLEAAGIKCACGLVAVLHSDADNMLLVLTARGLHHDLRIIAQALEPETEPKLRRAGASGVVLPHSIGGMRMASELIRPNVVTFLDLMLRSKDATIRVDEITIPHDSSVNGQQLTESGLLDVEGVSVVAFCEKHGSHYVFNPSCDTVLNPGSILIVMGNIELINQLKKRVQVPAAAPVS